VKRGHIIGVLVIAAFIAFGATEFSKTTTPYVLSFAEARKHKTDPVQVRGKHIKKDDRYDAKSSSFVFDLRDDSGDKMMVYLDGARPANFDQTDQVVVRGFYDGKVFRADQALVKCPSKYQGKAGI
jgi:cytochrome c-type biogenesis protein CcmE